MVNYDCKVSVGFASNPPIEISCGVVPDGTFPAPLTIGRTTLHQLGALYVPDSDCVKLTKLARTPLLCPIPKEELELNHVTSKK